MRTKLPLALCATLLVSPALANDGRNRYQQGYPPDLAHLAGPAGEGAGFRVLAEDAEGGADGDTAFRWSQPWTQAIIQVAAREVVRALGRGSFDMAIFDLSAENGDTPIDFGLRPEVPQEKAPATGKKAPRFAPRGRHPGGSHDGGLNLDLGYYMKSLKGKTGTEDYAACTEHFEPASPGTPEVDANVCTGPADRLDAERQAYFYLGLIRMHRNQFRGELLDEIGIDAAVAKAVRAVLEGWRSNRRFDVSEADIAELDAILTSDRAGGWRRFHHHHTHVRFHNLNPTGAWRMTLRTLEREARGFRAELRLAANPSVSAVIDAVLVSSGLERSIEVRTFTRGDLVNAKVRYRLDGGEWTMPDDETDNARYVFDAPAGLSAKEGTATVEAEVTPAGGAPMVISAPVVLPRRDPRLFLSHQPGEITATAIDRGGSIQLRVAFPDRLAPLVTQVRYELYPADGADPETHVVDAGWFKADPNAKMPVDATRTRSGDRALPVTVRRKPGKAYTLLRAVVMLSGRFAVSVPIAVGD